MDPGHKGETTRTICYNRDLSTICLQLGFEIDRLSDDFPYPGDDHCLAVTADVLYVGGYNINDVYMKMEVSDLDDSWLGEGFLVSNPRT